VNIFYLALRQFFADGKIPSENIWKLRMRLLILDHVVDWCI